MTPTLDNQIETTELETILANYRYGKVVGFGVVTTTREETVAAILAWRDAEVRGELVAALMGAEEPRVALSSRIIALTPSDPQNS